MDYTNEIALEEVEKEGEKDQAGTQTSGADATGQHNGKTVDSGNGNASTGTAASATNGGLTPSKGKRSTFVIASKKGSLALSQNLEAGYVYAFLSSSSEERDQIGLKKTGEFRSSYILMCMRVCVCVCVHVCVCLCVCV